MTSRYDTGNDMKNQAFFYFYIIIFQELMAKARHWKNTKFYHSLVSLKCKRMDFRDWILEKLIGVPKREAEFSAKLSDQQRAKPFDFVFMFRLLNNMNKFSIEHTADWNMIQVIMYDNMIKADWSQGAFRPHYAIPSGQLEKIVLSTKQISLKSGVTWCLSSLSDYFQALHHLSGGNMSDLPVRNAVEEVFFPVRKLDLDAIQYGPGRNIFVDLCRLCHFVLIEDIDLQSSHLRDHLIRWGHSRIKVIELPSRIPSSHTLCVFEE